MLHISGKVLEPTSEENIPESLVSKLQEEK
jgi:hypothetical protein